MLFEPGSYRVASKHNNLIAFTVEVGLFLKELRSAAQHEADTLDIRLSMRKVPTSGRSVMCLLSYLMR